MSNKLYFKTLNKLHKIKPKTFKTQTCTVFNYYPLCISFISFSVMMSEDSNIPELEGLRIPDQIVTKRTRTLSVSGRIENEVRDGTVKFFCRSRGHGFVDQDQEQFGKVKEDKGMLKEGGEFRNVYGALKAKKCFYKARKGGDRGFKFLY